MANWSLITGIGRKISSKVIRTNIVKHLTKHHQGSLVHSIEKKFNAYKINLMCGLSLIFDADGRYVKANS